MPAFRVLLFISNILTHVGTETQKSEVDESSYIDSFETFLNLNPLLNVVSALTFIG
jgi:hypothetical protein